MIENGAVAAMSAPSPAICEVKIDGAWQAVTLTEAHAKHGRTDKRCPACHGRVIVAGNYTQGLRLNLSHRKNHRGCPLTPKAFRGEVWPHPEALAYVFAAPHSDESRLLL